MTILVARIDPYLRLIRFDKQIGTLLLLWPTLWALWLAGAGRPDSQLIVIFCLGTFLMRSAGCVINDFADRNLDGSVKRTQARPLATGEIQSREALWFFVALALAAFGLVLMTNALTILLSIGAVAVAALYPFCKRFTQLPQLVLGVAFSFGIPMAFAAQTGRLPAELWLIFGTNLIWTTMYDTYYAMVDRDDDRIAGIKSTAILFGHHDRTVTAILAICVIFGLLLTGQAFGLGDWYLTAVALATGFFIYQQWLIRSRQRELCFQAFLNNHYVGMVIFIGIAMDYLFRV